MLFLDDARQRLFQGHVGRQGKNPGTRDHDLAHGDFAQFERALDHLFLELGNDAEAAGGGHDQLQLLRRMDHGGTHLMGPEAAQHEAGRSADHAQERARHGHEEIHGSGDGQGHALGPLQGHGLRHDFAQDNVEVGDEDEGQRDGDGVSQDGGVIAATYRQLDQGGQGGLANPAQSEAGQGDTELDGAEQLVHALVQLADGAGADAAGLDELLDAGVADADQGKFRRHEEGIGRHQQQDGKHPQEHISGHWRNSSRAQGVRLWVLGVRSSASDIQVNR